MATFHYNFWNSNLLNLDYLPGLEQSRISYFQGLNALRLLKILGLCTWRGSHGQALYSVPWIPATFGMPIKCWLSNKCFKTSSYQKFWVTPCIYSIYIGFDLTFWSAVMKMYPLANFFYFQLLFDCPTASLGLLLKVQPHSPNVNHIFQSEGHRMPSSKVGSLGKYEKLALLDALKIHF